jgi:uncharacterized protein DUF4129
MGPIRRLSLVGLSFWLVTGFSTPAQAQAPEASSAASGSELDLNAYRGELSRISEAVKRRENLPAVQKSLPSTWRVKTKQESYEVSTKEISDALREIGRDPEKNKKVAAELESRLNTLQQAADELGSSETKSAKRAEEKLQHILGRSEFQEAAGPSAMDRLRAQINRWIFEHLLRLLSRLHISRRTGNYFSWGVIVLAIVAVFYVLYRWLSQSTGEVKFKAETEPMTSDVRHWLQEALKAAERGDYREAIHCGYWASVARLEEMRVLPRDRARTPRESLRLLEHNPREQGVLQTVTRSFEPIWYGYRPASHEEWAATKEQLEKMGCLPGSTAQTAQS